MTYRVYSGPPGSEAVPVMEKERWLYKEFGLLDEALGWARHVNSGGRVTLLIEGDDGTRLTKTEISAALTHPEAPPRAKELRKHSRRVQPESGCLLELGFAHTPFMLLAASRASRANGAAANAQQRVELAIDPDVDVLTRCRADEMQMFHGGLLTERNLARRCVRTAAQFRPSKARRSQFGERELA